MRAGVLIGNDPAIFIGPQMPGTVRLWSRQATSTVGAHTGLWLRVTSSAALQGVCHRDLKLENTLLDGNPAPRLKICDFGYSKVCLPPGLQSTPEIGASVSMFGLRLASSETLDGQR